MRSSILTILLVGLSLSLLNGCALNSRKHPKRMAPAATGDAKHDGKSVKTPDDDTDDYAVISIADPLEPLNRVTFWINDRIYTFVIRPISKTYDTVIPGLVRTGIYNAYDNIQFPVRFVNDSLQWKFARAGREAEKFAVNTVGGVGGIMRTSDRFPALTNVPPADTGQTFAKWGINHGIYIVLPLLGPKSLRDTVGLVGDYALNPISWLTFGLIGGVSGVTTLAVSTPDTVRDLHGKMGEYDAVTQNTLDRYLAVRTAYIQKRKQDALK